LLEKFYKELYFYACTVSNFEQYTLAAFIKEGYFEKHINRMRIYYKKIRKQVMEIFKESSLALKAEILEENAGLHFLMRIKTSYTDEELIRRVAQKNIRITCLSQYYAHHEDVNSHILIMNYSGIALEHVGEVFETLSNCME